MKTIFNYAAWLLFVIVFALTGCSDDKSEPAPETPEPSIEFGSETDLKPVVSVEGGTSTLTFTASDDWTASVSAVTRAIDWLSVSPTQGGAGTVTLQITTQPNDTYDERNAAIVLSCGNVQKTVTLTQKQKDALLVTSNKVEMEAIGGTFGIELQANVDVSYEIEEAAREWLTVASSSTRGLTTSTLNFQASENTDTETRQAVITLRGGELTEKVTVYQAGSDPSILLSQKEYTVASDGETIQVELKSNVSYEVVMPEVQWITEASTRAVSSYTHYFVISPNDTYDARSAEISFINKENNIEEKVVITQVQKDAIIVAQSEYTVASEGGKLDFSVNTNVDFTVETSVDWIQQVTTRGLVEKPLSFNIAANVDNEQRQGVISIISGDLKQELVVIQEAVPAIILTQKEYTVKSEGGVIQVDLQSNINYDIRFSANWITEASTRAMSAYTHYFVVSPNDTYDARSAEIVFINKENNIEEKVVITQAQKDAIIVAQNEYTVASEGGKLDFSVNTNVDFTVETSVDWIQQVTTRGLVEKPLSFNIAANVDNEQRQGVISIISGDLKQELVVIQEAVPAIILTQKEYTVKSEGGVIQVDLQSNINYDIRFSANWITEASTRAMSAYTHYFVVSPNDTYDARSAEIVFINKENNIEEKVVITQSQKDVLFVNTNRVEIDAVGGTFNVELQANVDVVCEVEEIAKEWLSVNIVSTRGLTESFLRIQVAENRNKEARQAVVTLYGNHLEEQIVIYQSGGQTSEGNIDDIIDTEWQ